MSKLPPVGLEPTTLRLKVWCSTDWAKGALWLLSAVFYTVGQTVVSSTAGIEPARFDWKSKRVWMYLLYALKVGQLRPKNPPRFELGTEDSKSSVLTTTLWVQNYMLSPLDRKIKTKLGCWVICCMVKFCVILCLTQRQCPLQGSNLRLRREPILSRSR